MLIIRQDGTGLLQVGDADFVEVFPCNDCDAMIEIDQFVGSRCVSCAGVKWGQA